MSRRHTLFNLANQATPNAAAIPRIPTLAERAERYATIAKVRDNKPNRRKEPAMPENTVALAVLSLELSIPVEALTQRFGSSVVTDAAGCRAVGVDYARTFVAARRAEQQAQREEAQRRRGEAQAKGNPTRARVQALARRQAARSADPDVPAYARMVAGTDDDRLQRAGNHMDEMLSGATTMT